MFNFIDPKEERHERIAQVAANLCVDQHFDPTDALSKVASENGLNTAEVEDVCAKLNHILFRQKFAEDKLAVFNAAQYDKVSGNAGKTEQLKVAAEATYYNDMANDIQKRAEEAAAMPVEEQAAAEADPIMADASNKLRSHEFNRFLEQAASNASEISAHHMAIDNIVAEMKERIIALYREGVSLEEIYDTILMSVGDSQAPAVQEYFTGVVEDLKANGIIPQDQKVYFDDPEKLAADFSVDPKISQMSKDIKMHMNKVLIKEAAHEEALNLINELGRFDVAETIDKPIDANRFTAAFEKVAANQYIAGKAGQGLNGLLKANQGALLGSVALAATLAAVRAGGLGLSSGYRELKRNKVKKMLPNMYPELQQMSEKQYSDLYDTITNLNPGLIKAPYAVAEMIKRYAEYGTIDTGNILDLQGASRHEPVFTDFLVGPATDVVRDVATAAMNKDE